MDRLLNFTTGMSVLLIALVLTSLRRAHIRVEYSVSWLMASLAILVLSRVAIDCSKPSRRSSGSPIRHWR